MTTNFYWTKDGKAKNLALLTSTERCKMLETLRQTEAKEWIRRYRKKMKDLGKMNALGWWRQVLLDIGKKRGLNAVNDLRRRMNEIRR